MAAAFAAADVFEGADMSGGAPDGTLELLLRGAPLGAAPLDGVVVDERVDSPRVRDLAPWFCGVLDVDEDEGDDAAWEGDDRELLLLLPFTVIDATPLAAPAMLLSPRSPRSR